MRPLVSPLIAIVAASALGASALEILMSPSNRTNFACGDENLLRAGASASASSYEPSHASLGAPCASRASPPVKCERYWS